MTEDARASWRTLPNQVVLPEKPPWDNNYPREWLTHLQDYAAWLRENHGATVLTQDFPQQIPHSFVLKIDSCLGMLNINDLGHLPNEARGKTFQFMFFKQCISRMEHYQTVFPWPTHAQPTLARLYEMREATAASSTHGNGKINARFFSHQINSRPALAIRRKYAVELLKKRFGSRVEDETTRDQAAYAKAIVESSVNVHIPGGYQNCWDRSPALIFALGGMLVQPTIFPLVGWTRPRPWNEYLEVWDDLDNLCEVVQYALDHPDICQEIRINARQFWESNCSPYETWRRIKWVVERTRPCPA